MTTAGGGWTLTFNEGPSFARTEIGQTSSTCYAEKCTNRAYSTVPVTADIMMDAADVDIVEEGYEVRVVIHGVHAATIGNTVRTLFTSLAPFFGEKEDNSNIELMFAGAGSCDLLPTSSDFRGAACGSRVFTFSDRGEACNPVRTIDYAIGISESHTQEAYNCAGWPERPNQGSSSEYNFWPDNFRFWVR